MRNVHKTLSSLWRTSAVACLLGAAVLRASAQDPGSAGLTLPPAPVDPAFSARLSARPAVIVPQPDGKLLVAGDETLVAAGQTQQGLCRLNADGSIDASFDAGAGIDGGAVSQLILQPDGKIVVIGSFAAIDGVPAAGAARLNADGSRDPSFSASSQRACWRRLSNGGFVAVTPPSDSSSALVTRMTSAGAVIDQTTFSVLLNGGTSDYALHILSLQNTADDQGRMYFVGSPYAERSIQRGSFLFRLLPDGRVDSSYAVRNIGNVAQLDWIGGKLCYETLDIPPPDLGVFTATFGRLDEEGNQDPSFHIVKLTINDTDRAGVPCGAFAADGSLVVNTPFKGLVRYDATGARDYSYYGYLDKNAAAITALMLRPGGDLLATGDFTTLNGAATQRLARLHPTFDAYLTRLRNFSTRSTAGVGDRTLITGFIITGDGAKSILARGVGPTLAYYGVHGVLADPALGLYQLGTFLEGNNDWDAGLARTFAPVGAFGLPAGSKDAALLVALTAGGYTNQITSADPSIAPGIALAEFYDTDPAPTNATQARLANISARSEVGTGDNVLIGGFIVTGPGVRRFLIRAVGPGLADYGVGGVLADPQLTVYAGNTVIATNDNWSDGGATAAAPVAAATNDVGTFKLYGASKDAALVVALPAGIYTAKVSGVGDTTGVALVEIYEIP